MGIITDLVARGKAFLGRIPEGVLTLLIVLLASSGSFGLGILYATESKQGGAEIERLPMESRIETGAVLGTSSEEPAPEPMAQGGQYVASSKGKKYHLPWCSGAKSISEANKIYFSSKAEAEAAGYTPAANCKGI